MSGVSSKTVTDDEAGMRLDRWFKAHFPTLGFGRLQKLLRSGQIRVEGKRAKTNQRLETGQQVRIPPISDQPPEVRNEANERDREAVAEMTLHDDGTVLVLNKQVGLAVQGGPGLTRHVDGLLGALTSPDGQRPRLVHRLDRETSGILLIAKTRLAAKSLAESFKARDTQKIYWGLVAGVPKPRQGRISTWLKKQEGPEGDSMRSYLQRQAGAVHAVSQYAVVEQSAHKLSWLVLQPVTGRTHQLRVHAAEIGHPIVGDAKYFNIENWHLPGGIQNRLHLHARSIAIPHPDGGVLEVSAPLPDHMRQSWNLLGLDQELGDKFWRNCRKMAGQRLVIFDCDGTLVDSQDLIVQAMDLAFEQMGLTPPARQNTLSIVGLSLIEAMEVLVPDASPADQQVLAERYKTSFGSLVSDTDRQEPLYEGAADAVRSLSARDDVVLGIATGKSQRGVRRVLSEHDLHQCFITIQTADDAPSKPHPAMIHQAMAEAGAEPQNTVMIGDTVYDLQMAQAAGVPAVGVDWGYHTKAELQACNPDALLSHFNDLHDVLNVFWQNCD